jgi:hypothetical protein
MGQLHSTCIQPPALHQHLLQDGRGHVHRAPQVRVARGGEVKLSEQGEGARVAPEQPRGVQNAAPHGHHVHPHRVRPRHQGVAVQVAFEKAKFETRISLYRLKG